MPSSAISSREIQPGIFLTSHFTVFLTMASYFFSMPSKSAEAMHGIGFGFGMNSEEPDGIASDGTEVLASQGAGKLLAAPEAGHARNGLGLFQDSLHCSPP